MLKRSGRGHSKSGAASTQHGECAVLCPACPQPGKNLPDGWQNVPDNKRWVDSPAFCETAMLIEQHYRFLYRLFLGMDANFRLKRRMVSNNASDPSLSNGWSYFVEEDNYKEFLNAFGKLVIQEVLNFFLFWPFTHLFVSTSLVDVLTMTPSTKNVEGKDLLHRE